jgi:hypothetical protein
MRNAEHAPTDTPKSIRLIKHLKSKDFIAPPALATHGPEAASPIGDIQRW